MSVHSSKRLSGRVWVSSYEIIVILLILTHAQGIWEAMDLLNTLVDESDPDVGFVYVLVTSMR